MAYPEIGIYLISCKLDRWISNQTHNGVKIKLLFSENKSPEILNAPLQITYLYILNSCQELLRVPNFYRFNDTR